MDKIPQIIKTEFSTIWKLSHLSFVIAALTGALYRYGFGGLYYYRRKKLQATLPLLLFDAA